MTVTASIRGKNTNMYLIFADAVDNAKLENVTFENLTFTITASVANTPDNIAYDEANADKPYSSNKWICGGEDSDDTFFAKHTGLTVKNAELLIGTRSGEEVSAETYGK